MDKYNTYLQNTVLHAISHTQNKNSDDDKCEYHIQEDLDVVKYFTTEHRIG